MKRFLALALSLLMILGVLLMAGCNNNNNNSTPTTGNKPVTPGTTAGTPGTDGTTGGDIPTTPTNDPYQKMPGYDDITFGGRVFTLVGADGESDGFNSAKEIYSEYDKSMFFKPGEEVYTHISTSLDKCDNIYQAK